MILLENENIKVAISTKGAELRSIHSKTTDIEYLWKGDPLYWGKFSPVLFPIIGALKDNKYIFEGQEYELPRHGFARDQEFEAEQMSNEEVLFTLYQTEETLQVYPFEFKLVLRYKITGASVICSYEVFNPGSKEMLFSVGGHPAFAAPLTEGSAYEDYYLEFNKEESITYHKIASNLISDQTETLALREGKLMLKHELFYNDALVFKNLKSDLISVKNTKNDQGINFRFENFPYFGIWAAKDADFICLEPWCGIADGTSHNQQLRDKEGIISLSPGQDWKRSWEVEIF